MIEQPIHILHLEDNSIDAQLIQAKLEAHKLHCDIVRVKDRQSFEAAITEKPFDLIMSDFSVPHYDGFAALKFAREKNPDVPFILVSGTLGEEQAVTSLKNGATDYIVKERLERLGPAVSRALTEARERKEREETEQRLRAEAQASEARFRILVEEALVGIYMIEEDRFVYVNPSMTKILGYTAAEITSRPLLDFVHPDDRTVVRENVRQRMQGETLEAHYTLRMLRHNQDIAFVEARGRRIDLNGRRAIMGTLLDITEKKQTEAKLLRTQRMESIGALAGGIAHDLNNSLAPILMAAELLKDELQTQSSKELLNMMTSSAQKGADMVRQILSFSRGVTGQHASLHLKDLIVEMEKFVRSTFPRSIRVQAEIKEPLAPVSGDATQIHQVLMNLCINARDAMPNGGTLLIKVSDSRLHATRSEKRHVVLSVSDTGQGMSPEVKSKIFEPFFTTKEMGKGTGLGLSTVMEIVKTHCGFVEVSSELGKGTTFQVFLPAELEEAQESIHDRSLPPAGSGELILVIDDDTALLEMSKLVFEAYNYQIITARDGAEGLSRFQQHQESLKVVITDMMMPNMSGPELIQKLREIKPAVKIIGVSGVSSEMWLGKVGKVDIDAFLKKPFSTESLLLKLHELAAA